MDAGAVRPHRGDWLSVCDQTIPRQPRDGSESDGHCECGAAGNLRELLPPRQDSGLKSDFEKQITRRAALTFEIGRWTPGVLGPVQVLAAADVISYRSTFPAA